MREVELRTMKVVFRKGGNLFPFDESWGVEFHHSMIVAYGNGDYPIPCVGKIKYKRDGLFLLVGNSTRFCRYFIYIVS